MSSLQPWRSLTHYRTPHVTLSAIGAMPRPSFARPYGTRPVIPPKRNEAPVACPKWAYRHRHLVENFWACLKAGRDYVMNSLRTFCDNLTYDSGDVKADIAQTIMRTAEKAFIGEYNQ